MNRAKLETHFEHHRVFAAGCGTEQYLSEGELLFVCELWNDIKAHEAVGFTRRLNAVEKALLDFIYKERLDGGRL